MTKQTSVAVYRHVIPVDGYEYEIVDSGPPLHVGCRTENAVEFWAFHTPGAPKRNYIVIATGAEVPASLLYHGTAISPGGHLVWHLFEDKSTP